MNVLHRVVKPKVLDSIDDLEFYLTKEAARLKTKDIDSMSFVFKLNCFHKSESMINLTFSYKKPSVFGGGEGGRTPVP